MLERAKGLLETANLEACVRECEYGIWTQRRGATTAVLAAALKLVLADALRAEADSSSLARVLSLYEEVKPVVAECVKQKRQAEFGGEARICISAPGSSPERGEVDMRCDEQSSRTSSRRCCRRCPVLGNCWPRPRSGGKSCTPHT